MATKKVQEPQETSAISLFDPELMGEEFNCPRQARLAYGIVINDNPSGIFIPEKNSIKAGWHNLDVSTLPELDMPSGEKLKGLFLGSVRMIVLGAMPPYIRFKNNDDSGEMKGVAIGLYETDRHLLDKKIHEVCSEYLVMFLDETNQLLHDRPIRIRYKNVALWCLKEALEDFYSQMEIAFAKLAGLRPSGKDDRWRSLCVFEAKFKAEKEGEGSNRSYCCKVESYTKPDTEANFYKLFLGSSDRAALRVEIWDNFDMNAAGMQQIALPARNINALPFA